MLYNLLLSFPKKLLIKKSNQSKKVTSQKKLLVKKVTSQKN